MCVCVCCQDAACECGILEMISNTEISFQLHLFWWLLNKTKNLFLSSNKRRSLIGIRTVVRHFFNIHQSVLVSHFLSSCPPTSHTVQSVFEPSYRTFSTSSFVRAYLCPFQLKCVGGAYSPLWPNSKNLLSLMARLDLISPIPPVFSVAG